MNNVCIICGQELTQNKCKCGFDLSKNYETYRTLCTIPKRKPSTKKLRLKYEEKINKKKNSTPKANVPVKNDEEFVFNTSAKANVLAKSSEERAFDNMLQLAYSGSVYWQCKVAECYNLGKGVTLDKDKACEWYKKAAEQGDKTAQQALEEIEKSKRSVQDMQSVKINEKIEEPKRSVQSKESENSIEKFKSLNFSSQMDICYDYYGKRDYKEAYKWCKIAIDEGNISAMTFRDSEFLWNKATGIYNTPLTALLHLVLGLIGIFLYWAIPISIFGIPNIMLLPMKELILRVSVILMYVMFWFSYLFNFSYLREKTAGRCTVDMIKALKHNKWNCFKVEIYRSLYKIPILLMPVAILFYGNVNRFWENKTYIVVLICNGLFYDFYMLYWNKKKYTSEYYRNSKSFVIFSLITLLIWILVMRTMIYMIL